MIMEKNIKDQLVTLFKNTENKQSGEKIVMEMNREAEEPTKYYLGMMNSEVVLLYNNEHCINFLCSTNAYNSVRDFSETFGISEEGVPGIFVEVDKSIADAFYNSLNKDKITSPYTKNCYNNYKIG